MALKTLDERMRDLEYRVDELFEKNAQLSGLVELLYSRPDESVKVEVEGIRKRNGKGKS